MQARGSTSALLAVVGATLLAAYSCGGSEPVGVKTPTKTGEGDIIAREFFDGAVINLGIGIPTLCSSFIPEAA